MNLLNKIAKIVLMIVIFLCIFTVNSNATITGKVLADNIRLREKANTDSKILMLVSINENVDVIEKEGEWYKISYNGKTGYTKKEFIKLEEDEEIETSQQEDLEQENPELGNTNTEQNNETAPIENNTKTVSNTQSIYILPLINSSTIEEIQANTDIEVIQNTNGWSFVAVSSSNVSGWIRTDKLIDKLQEVEKEEETVEEKTEQEQDVEEKSETNIIEINKTGYIKKASVNLRKGPSTDNEKIGSLTLNTEIKVISEENGWYKIKANSKTGYVLKELVSFEKVEVTSRNAEAPRQEENTSTTNVTQATTMTEANSVPTDTVSSDLGKQIVDYAMTFVGYPYVYGGSTPSGFDCSGFTSYVYKHFGYSISRSSSAQASNGKEVAKADLQPGDLVLFKGVNSSRVGHVGIYIGGNQFVHASTEKTGVKVSSLSTSGYIKRYVTARRII